MLQVLGTFITEWAHGKEQCASLLADMPTADRAARQLAAIAGYYNFEGWLINIENELPEESIPTLLYFLRCVSSAPHQQTCNCSLALTHCLGKH